MIKISVKVPNDNRQYFSFSLRKGAGGGVMKSTSPVSVYRKLENRLSKAFLTEARGSKIVLKVDYGHGYTNRGEYTDKKAALYALACFMEDYLSEEYLDSRYKKYGESGGGVC